MKGLILGVMIAYGAGNIYLFIRSLQQMQLLPLWGRLLFSVVFWFLALALIIAMLMREVNMPDFLARTLFGLGSLWMVFILYMVLSLVLFDLIHLALPSFRGFYYALGLTLCLLLWGYWNYRHPKVVEMDIKLEKPLKQPLRIAMISDVHLGYNTDKKALKRYVELINDQNADMIFIGGDLIDNSTLPLNKQQMWEELQLLRAEQGIYMVAGNHEYISGIEKCREFLSRTPVELLQDSVVSHPSGIEIVGRDDRYARRRKPLKELLLKADMSRPVMVIDHQPYHLKQNDALGIDFQFSGHTHRGQVFPLNLLTDRLYEQSHGYRRWSNAHIYVSSGLSLWGPPLRIGTDSELVVINFSGK